MGISMRQKGRWAAVARALILFVCLGASCASVEEGAKWKTFPRPSVLRSYDWEKVTSVLEEARKNATFPGK